MAPTFLIVGATGNTGRAAVSTLSSSLSKDFPNHRILALSRSAQGSAAKQLAALPGVQVEEKNWVDIDPEWLQEHEVKRAFIASHNEPTQFAEESTFHLSCLQAGVEYVVRISTTAATVSPTSIAYYPRSHWAVEALLSTPEFNNLGWTSLQPNIFTGMFLAAAAQLVHEFKQSGKQGPLRLVADEHAPVASIDPDEVGVFAAKLLLLKDVSAHRSKKYVLAGPADISGKDIVAMVEKEIGQKVQDVRFRDVSFLHQWADTEEKYTKSLIRRIALGLGPVWEGRTAAKTTSKEVLDLAPPKKTPQESFAEMIKG